MKKLSKILVVVLTLAMLLGAIVISASASDKNVDVLDANGEVIYSHDKLAEALKFANEYDLAGDVTVRLNANLTLSTQFTSTRDANLGKVIIDLNGKILTLNAVCRYYGPAYAAGGASTATVYDTVSVVIGDAAPKLYFLKGLTLENPTLDGEAAETLVADNTYVADSVTAGTAVQTVELFKGTISVNSGSSLVVDGNGGTVSYSNGHAFYIDDGQDTAELLLRDFSVSSNSACYLVQTNSGVATLDGLILNRTSNAPFFRHASDSELNIKNCYITHNSSGAAANTALIFTEGTNLNVAKDGYHIEIENTTVVSCLPIIAGSNPNFGSCGSKAKNKFDNKSMYSVEEVRLKGVEYEDTSMLIKNCNMEQVNYYKPDKTRTDSWSLIQSGANFDIDFVNCNIYAAQWLVNSQMTGLNTSEINFHDCYVELTGKGNLQSGKGAAFLYGASGTQLNFYNTELRIGSILKENGNKIPGTETVATPTNYLANYAKMSFYAGCIFDGECAPNNADLKARIIQGTYITRTDVKGNVVEMLATGIDLTQDVFDYITKNTEVTSENLTVGATSGTLNPIVVLSNGRTLKENGASAENARQTIGSFACGVSVANNGQGIHKVAVDADGNKYAYWDPTYVKNDMTGYSTNYVAAADFAEGVVLPTGVTAVGGWDIDADGVLEYLDTDGNTNDAEYTNIAANGAGYKWVVIPDAYSSILCDDPWYQISSTQYYAPDHNYVTYSFDYKNADDSDYFFPLFFAVQARREFGNSGDSGNRGFELTEDGKVYVGNTDTGVTLTKGTWNNITIVVELIAEDVSKDESRDGHYINGTDRCDISYNGSKVYVFVNGVKAGTSFASGFNDAHAWVTGLRSANIRTIKGSHTDMNKALAGGAKLCADNVRSVGYSNDYKSSELDALLSGDKTKLSDWSDCIITLRDNQVSDFPEEKTPVAKIEWTPTASTWIADVTGICRIETKPSATVIYFDDINDALAHGAKQTVQLLADAEKANVNAPVTVNKNGKEFTYYSNAYKGTLDGSTLTFKRAKAAELIEVSYSYADDEGIIKEVLAEGSGFWFDISRIPKTAKSINPSVAREIVLVYNGNVLDSINLADYEKMQTISATNNSFIFSHEEGKQYGWIILDNEGKFSYDSADIGVTYDELVNRVNVIEALFDMNKNGDAADLVIENGVATGLVEAQQYASAYTTEGYTIKFFADFENAGLLTVNNQAKNKIVNYDLNGHTISYATCAIYSYTQNALLEYEPKTGKVVKVTKGGVAFTDATLAGDSKWGYQVDFNAITLSNGNKVYPLIQTHKLYVNVISSEPGAKMIANKTGGYGVVNTSYNTSRVKGNGVDIITWEAPTLTFGNAISDPTMIGCDENAINVECDVLCYNSAYLNDYVIRNLNVVSSYNIPIRAGQGKNVISNCNIYTTFKGGQLIQVDYPTQIFEVLNCNLISENPQILFQGVGNRGSYDSSLKCRTNFENTRIYNLKLDSVNMPTWSSSVNTGDNYLEVVTFGLNCYYSFEFAPTQTKSQYMNSSGKYAGDVNYAPFVLAASRAKDAVQYQANVYANETFTINGVDYTFTYKIAADADVVSVQWQDTNGNVIQRPVTDKDGIVTMQDCVDNYVKGGNLIAPAASRVDAIAKAKYTFDINPIPKDYAEKTLVVKAIQSKLIPAFSVKHNINLETNIKHNIKISRFVVYGGETYDMIDYISEVTVGGVKCELALNVGPDKTAGTSDDYYYYTVDVKSNAIAGEYDLVINFKTTDNENVEASLTLSVAKYLSGELAKAEKDSDLYNVCAAVVNYGIAAYSYEGFKGATGDVNVLKDLADKYPVADVVIGEADAGVAAGKVDVEFVLDDQLEYRFKFIDEAMIANWGVLTVEISYTDINGEVKTLSTNKTLEKYEGYFVDFVVDACEFAGDVTVRAYVLVNGEATNECTVTYNIANYYADALAVDASSTLLDLVEALNAYATYAKAYIKNK